MKGRVSGNRKRLAALTRRVYLEERRIDKLVRDLAPIRVDPQIDVYGDEPWWDDEPDEDERYQPRCINCDEPMPVYLSRRGPECCSDKCTEELRRYEDAHPTGHCGGCGREGAYGKPCFRPLDGVMEECGQFV